MAIKGEVIIVYFWDTDAYKPIGCLTSNGLSQTRNIIESQTKCNPGVVTKTAGSLNNEITFEGEYEDTTSATGNTAIVSHDYLFGLMNNATLIDWKMTTGLADDPAYYGTSAILGSLELTAPAGDDVATFSGSLAVDGAIVLEDPHGA